MNPAAIETAVPTKKFSMLAAGTQTNPAIPAVPGAVFSRSPDTVFNGALVP